MVYSKAFVKNHLHLFVPGFLHLQAPWLIVFFVADFWVAYIDCEICSCPVVKNRGMRYAWNKLDRIPTNCLYCLFKVVQITSCQAMSNCFCCRSNSHPDAIQQVLLLEVSKLHMGTSEFEGTSREHDKNYRQLFWHHLKATKGISHNSGEMWTHATAVMQKKFKTRCLFQILANLETL